MIVNLYFKACIQESVTLVAAQLAVKVPRPIPCRTPLATACAWNGTHLHLWTRGPVPLFLTQPVPYRGNNFLKLFVFMS